MSLQKKIEEAEGRGRLQERGRLLWLMADERKQLRAMLEGVILEEAKRHAMQVKIKMAVAIFEGLKMRIMAGHSPKNVALSPQQTVCDRCGGPMEIDPEGDAAFCLNKDCAEAI